MVSMDSSTDTSEASSDENENRFYSQQAVPRQATSSSSATSRSNTDESSAHRHPPGAKSVSNAPQPQKLDTQKKRQPKFEVQKSTPEKHTLKTHKDKETGTVTATKNASAKRDREEDKGEFEHTAKKKSLPKKADPGKKVHIDNPLHNNEHNEDKIPSSKPLKEKKSTFASHKDDEKKSRKQTQEAVSTPSVKESPQKSAKKPAQLWSAKDEVAFFKGLVAYSKGGKPFPKNMSPVYDHVRHLLDRDYTNSQLYDKMRRMKTKYQNIQDNAKENATSFKSPHDATLFKLWQQLWGQKTAASDEEDEEEGAAENYKNAQDAGKVAENSSHKPVEEDEDEETEEEEEKEETCHNIRGEDRVIQRAKGEEEEEEAEEPKERNKGQVLPISNNLSNNQNGEIMTTDGRAYNFLREEAQSMMNAVKNDVAMILADSQSQTRGFIESLFKVKPNSRQLPNIDLMNGTCSTQDFPILDRAKAKMFEQKWCDQQILEMEVYSKRLNLLQEECKACLEELKTQRDSHIF
eukprot:Gb_09186 [translate_table: standard]